MNDEPDFAIPESERANLRKLAAEAIRDFNARLSPDVLEKAPQECVATRRKPVVTVRLGLTARSDLKSAEELHSLSTDDLELYFYDIITDLRSLGLKFDFFPAPDLENNEENRRLIYLEALEHLRAILFSPTKDATKLGL